MDLVGNQVIGIVLCAGFGTRLKPLTDLLPKVILPLGDVPIAWKTIEELFKQGITEVHCNIHYKQELVEKVLSHLHSISKFSSLKLIFWREKDILETGGGVCRILNAIADYDQSVWEKTLYIVSGDIVSFCPFSQMYKRWLSIPKESKNVAMLATLPLSSERNDAIILSEDFSQILSFGALNPSLLQNTSRSQQRLFSNHQLLRASVFRGLPVQKSSIVRMVYQEILNRDLGILNFPWDSHWDWFNVGTFEEYAMAVASLSDENMKSLNNWPIDCLHNGEIFRDLINQRIVINNIPGILKDYAEIEDFVKERFSQSRITSSINTMKNSHFLQEAIYLGIKVGLKTVRIQEQRLFEIRLPTRLELCVKEDSSTHSKSLAVFLLLLPEMP